ncbi:hypothetical protein [Streptomyces sp. NPDC058665]|uniref:hypothetical protein n=1 Tax=Streptomyces sp. NPDC058665 TaxID=3346586 RepID=UPI00365FD46A
MGDVRGDAPLAQLPCHRLRQPDQRGLARRVGLANFSVFCSHVTIVPPLKAILESPDLGLDGFLGPGHVSTVVGNRPYRFVPEVYGKPIVVAGFEPLDILTSVAMLLRQIREGRCEVENQYGRVVREEGNPAAPALMSEVFRLRPHFEWRGLGFISQSALRLRRLSTGSVSCAGRGVRRRTARGTARRPDRSPSRSARSETGLAHPRR